ncbi:MAG: UDP-glucose/GDP-mannose dehydrogenase family protein [FCB group bacterium]|jgi:UDPglucose 6-dehydrogenase|nr:UDP-glucose/GDP-mannose dehydrogenase family protein [FCB group bacterium]
MKIAVVGTGYVGLVVGTGFAENGHAVVCVDRQDERIDRLSKGELPFYEPGLEELVTRNVEEERLHFTSDLAQAVKDSLIVFICVGTPTGEAGSLDTSAVFAVAEDVAKAMTGYRIVVNKSTCPLGTTEQLRDRIKSLTTHPFDMVTNPEFLKEGAAVDDFMRPDRVVIGCDDVRVEEIMRELYAPFLRTGKPLLVMDFRSAEMSKYAVNAMLAARISLMNELSTICSAYDADIAAVREAVAADSRIGSAYLFPGIGFGGSCLPKDVIGAASLAEKADLPANLLLAIAKVNDRQLDSFIARILAYYGASLAGKRIAIWGAAFKPRTDDLRGAPALQIIDALLNRGAKVSVYDPVAGPNLREYYGTRITVAPKSYAALEDADGLVIATEWNEFRRPDYERIAEALNERVIFDGRNLYTPKVLAEAGFQYFSIGRPSIDPHVTPNSHSGS